jgi:hypothetical protein
MLLINCLIIIFTNFSPYPSCPRFLVGHPFSDNLDSRLRGCVAITLKCRFVILNEVKNLIISMCCKTEILRLGPQNDIVTQSLRGNDGLKM